MNGDGTVIAPDYIRTDVAEVVCQTLLDRGALTVMMTLEGQTEARRRSCIAIRIRSRLPLNMSICERGEVPRYLPLGDTLDSTLASLGEAHATQPALLPAGRLRRLNWEQPLCLALRWKEPSSSGSTGRSMYPAPEAIAAWRHDAMERTSDSFFAGVKAGDGRWLSLIGGRRHAGVTEIDWQMNLAGLPRFSLSTVMRSYILEHEIELGTREIEFIGGTPHSMRHSFACVNVVDVIVQRRSANAWLLRRLARWIFPENNFLGQALRDKTLRWTKW